MLQGNKTLSEDYLIRSFLSGLKEELKSMVMIMRPQTLALEIQIAKIHEKSIEHTKLRFKNTVKQATSSFKSYKPLSLVVNPRVIVKRTKGLLNARKKEKGPLLPL